MTVAPWTVGGACLKINPLQTVVPWTVGGACLKINTLHDHSTLVCWWCPSQRLSELNAETNEYLYQLY